MRRFAIAAGLLLIVAVSLPTLAIDSRSTSKADWPQWRGPNRDNISPDTGLLKEWPEAGPPLVWRVSGLGKGFSGVSVVGNKLFTMGDFEKGQDLICRQREDGKELWKLRVGDVWKNYEGPRCTPTVDGNFVYAVGTHGDLVCAKVSDGTEVWRKNFGKDFGGKMHSGWGFSESPLVDGNLVICTPGGPDAMLAALNKKTGEEVWRSTVPGLGEKGGDGAAYSSIVIGNGCGTKQYVQLVGRGLVGVDAKNGKFLWGYNRVANGTANIPTPLISGDYVFGSTGYGTGSVLVKLEKNSSVIDAKEQYFLDAKELQNHHGGMVMLGDYIYCGHGHGQGAPVCLEWKTGKFPWREGRGPGRQSAAVSYADGNLIFRYEDGTMALIEANPKEYVLHGTFKIPEGSVPSWPQPVIIGGKMYLRDQDNLLCYDVRKP